ncbi:hypothetical protein Tco_0655957 [Tanacetum coccineum]|uniref:Uncharacterized protein n=1 Tax=Tanacetum coccineum TaxID=301880 RepID=A0ABQ4X7X4_9ASTR
MARSGTDLKMAKLTIGIHGRKAHLLEDKQIPTVRVFDEVFSTWMAFGGNTRDLGSFGEESNKTTDLHQISQRIMHTASGDGVAAFEGDHTDCQALHRAWTTMRRTTLTQADLLRRFENLSLDHPTLRFAHEGCREMAEKLEETKKSRDHSISLLERFEAIERLKKGESINVQDLETNLYWEFGKFISWVDESLESYYSRFVTLVKQSQELKTVSYHKLYDILKQHQNEVNEIRAERLARTANPLALVAQQQPVYHPQNHPNHYTQNSSTKSQQATTKNREKAIVNSPPPTYDQEPTMVTEDDELSKEKEIDKLMDLISLSFKKIYKPTNNNLRTSSNTSRANQDNTPRINKGTGYDNQRAVNVARDKENIARECQKLKRAKDAAYHKEKMLLCKQEEAGFQFKSDQEHPVQPEYINDTYLVEQGDSIITIDSLDMSTNGKTVNQD